MENRNTIYYTLKYERTDTLHKKGEVIVIPSGELPIGQQEDCMVLFKNGTEFEDEQFAVIRPTRNPGEWQIIPTSEHISTSVNGIPVNLVHYLNDGDRITFDDIEQELLFKVHYDNKCNAAEGIQTIAAPISNKFLSLIIAIPIILFSLLAAYLFIEKSTETERNKLLDSLHASILQISVDSVIYVEITPDGEHVLRTFSYQNSEGHIINGTAFLTTDSTIVTARHCIEPWLNDPSIATANTPKEAKSVPSSWAMEAETYNQLHESDTSYRVVAICNFYQGQNGTMQFGRSYKSSEFIIDTSRDHIVEKGDFKNVYYWRSIKETYSNKDMILDDVAWAKTDSIGGIILAKEEELQELLASRPHFYFMGYPDHNTMRGFSTTEGKMQMEYAVGNVIAHDGNLIHGYSGAPAIVINRNKAYAVGVVSRLDANGGGRSYSVPVSELKTKGEKR